MINVDGFCIKGMLDTCNCYLQLSQNDQIDIGNLTNVRKITDAHNGQLVKYSGKLRNLIVEWSHSYLRISGSISKYYFGHNIFLLNRNEIKKAIDTINKDLGIDVSKSIIRRLDFACDLSVSTTVEKYYPFFSDKPYHLRSHTTLHSLYYTNSNRQTIIYNKGLQMEQELKKPLPIKNLMRIECRFKTRFIKLILKQIKQEDLRLSDLSRQEIYGFFINQWEKEYRSIRKEFEPVFDLSKLKGPNEIIHLLAREGISNLGGVNKVLEIINSSQLNKLKPYRAFKSRIKRQIRKIAEDERFINRNSLMTDLEQLVDKRIHEITQANISLP